MSDIDLLADALPGDKRGDREYAAFLLDSPFGRRVEACAAKARAETLAAVRRAVEAVPVAEHNIEWGRREPYWALTHRRLVLDVIDQMERDAAS